MPLSKIPAPASVQHFRDILLEDPSARGWGGWLRSCLAKTVDNLTTSPQFGSGLNCGGTEVTFLCIEAVVGAILANGKSAVPLYIDVAAAFAEVARCLIIPEVRSKSSLVDAAVAAGMERDFTEAAVEDLT